MNIHVLGAGSWGTALTILLGRHGHDVTLFGRPSEELNITRSLHENLHYLPGHRLPDTVTVTDQPYELGEADFWVVATPSHAVREMMEVVRGDRPRVVMASKGLEPGTRMLLCDVAAEICPNGVHGVISGPNLADEIVKGIPTVAVCAFAEEEEAEIVRGAFQGRSFRVYTGHDVIGVELAGALKNVLALGAGMSDGLGFGNNTKGALLARGLYEMASLGISMGAKLDTFMGIAGVGDLFATATSHLSRNYRVGRLIGEGHTRQEALDMVGQVAEGVSTSESAQILAKQQGIETPTMGAIHAVLQGQVPARVAVERLMERLPKSEGILPR